jgi:hypothetical protein
MSIYASFMCSLFFADFIYVAFFYFIYMFPFFLCFYVVHFNGYTPMYVSCAKFMIRISWITVITFNYLYKCFIWCKIFGLFTLRILLDNPCVLIAKCHIFPICLFVNGGLLLFCIVYRVRNLTFICVSLKSFVILFVTLRLNVKALHLVFSMFSFCFCWLGCHVPSFTLY